MKLTALERRAVISLSGIFALRMFGLFLVLPVLSLYAADYHHSTPFLVGLTLGIYGLTQAVLQIPFGLLSDRLGRKRLITIGLVIFALGSVIAASASDIYWLIAGRAIQGAGAISAAVLALAADLTREEQRTKTMAIIGMSIGFVFLSSVTIAPPLAEHIGLAGLFWLVAVLAVLAIVVLHKQVPNAEVRRLHRDLQPVRSQLKSMLADPQLARLDLGIFVLHLVLTALFTVLPAELVRLGGLSGAEHWKVYLPVVLLSVGGMAPLIMLSSRQHLVIAMFRLTIAILSIGLFGLGLVISGLLPIVSGLAGLAIALWLFFVGFNGLEAMLPSLVSRVAPAAARGTAIGIYNTCQFLGIFVGGVSAGVLHQQYGSASVLWFCSILGGLWLLVALASPAFRLFSSRVFDLGIVQEGVQRRSLIDRIGKVRGVQEVTVVGGETLAYLKVDDRELDTAALHQLNQT